MYNLNESMERHVEISHSNKWAKWLSIGVSLVGIIIAIAGLILFVVFHVGESREQIRLKAFEHSLQEISISYFSADIGVSNLFGYEVEEIVIVQFSLVLTIENIGNRNVVIDDFLSESQDDIMPLLEAGSGCHYEGMSLMSILKDGEEISSLLPMCLGRGEEATLNLSALLVVFGMPTSIFLDVDPYLLESIYSSYPVRKLLPCLYASSGTDMCGNRIVSSFTEQGCISAASFADERAKDRKTLEIRLGIVTGNGKRIHRVYLWNPGVGLFDSKMSMAVDFWWPLNPCE